MKMAIKMAALDWRSMKVYHKLLFFSTPWFMFIFGVGSMLSVVPVCAMYYSLIATWLFSVEEKGESHRLYLTLPVKKREIVAGRYLLSFLLFVSSIVIGIVIMYIKDKSGFFWFNIVKGEFLSGSVLLTMISASYLLNTFLSLCAFPFFYWLGYTKGKIPTYIAINLIFLGFILAFALLENRQESPIIHFINFASENMALVNGLFVIVGTAVLALSYFISLKVYLRRDH